MQKHLNSTNVWNYQGNTRVSQKYAILVMFSFVIPGSNLPFSMYNYWPKNVDYSIIMTRNHLISYSNNTKYLLQMCCKNYTKPVLASLCRLDHQNPFKSQVYRSVRYSAQRNSGNWHFAFTRKFVEPFAFAGVCVGDCFCLWRWQITMATQEAEKIP